jgi:hypothetical protein
VPIPSGRERHDALVRGKRGLAYIVPILWVAGWFAARSSTFAPIGIAIGVVFVVLGVVELRLASTSPAPGIPLVFPGNGHHRGLIAMLTVFAGLVLFANSAITLA